MSSADRHVLSPVAPSTLADELLAKLRPAIVSGALRPGERLSEPELAARMAVSRGPVREALLQLENEGLVHSRTNRGTYVWTPSEADVDEILSLRAVLETLAARWAMQNMNDDDLAYLSGLLLETENANTLDPASLVKVDREFHEFVCRKAQRPRTFDAWLRIRSQWEVILYYQAVHYPDLMKQSMLEDHCALLAALKERNISTIQKVNDGTVAKVGARVRGVARALGANRHTDGTPPEPYS